MGALMMRPGRAGGISISAALKRAVARSVTASSGFILLVELFDGVFVLSSIQVNVLLRRISSSLVCCQRNPVPVTNSRLSAVRKKTFSSPLTWRELRFTSASCAVADHSRFVPSLL